MSAAQAPIRLHANENFFGCSPLVLETIKDNYHRVSAYPAYAPVQLEAVLAAKNAISTDSVAVGAGSVRIIDGIMQSLVKPGEEILLFDTSFVAYYQLAEMHNIPYTLVPLSNFTCLPDNALTCLKPHSRAIFIANPNNPTGTCIPQALFEKFMQQIPEDVLVVVDEAYIEYVQNPAVLQAMPLIHTYKNLLVIRTFSKIYGLAGLRIGYVAGHPSIITQLKSKRIPFTINFLAEQAAMAALQDEAFIAESIRKNTSGRTYLQEQLCAMGFQAIPSEANFIYVYVPDEALKNAIHAAIEASGILVCNLSIFSQPNALRIGIADKPVHDCLLNIFKSFV